MSSIHPHLLILMTAGIATVPLVIGVATSYLKISIVMGMLRSGLGTQNVPGPLVVTALSLALTSFIMQPVVEESVRALDTIRIEDLRKSPGVFPRDHLSGIVEPWYRFLTAHSGVREREVMRSLTGHRPETGAQDLRSEWRVILVAFLLTELREAFSMAFVVLLPFLVIDLVVANVLVGMGMFMVSPVMIALPLKLLLVVSSDAWLLLIRGLIASYGGT